MVRVYNLFILLYALAIRLASPFHKKARLWFEGRQNQLERLKREIDPGKPLVWMHCASLGEFEQGLPVLEKIKAQRPEMKILITFFSPSGYEIRKNHELADHVCYLPADTPNNAEEFLSVINPNLVIFVRYELWFNFLSRLSQKEVPLVLLSAVFRPGQVFFRPWGQFFRKMLGYFDHIFVQDERSGKLLANQGIHHFEVTGDTRVDRVCKIAEEDFSDVLISAFVEKSEVLIAGSTWSPDENILAPFINNNQNTAWKFIVAPHNIEPAQIEKLEQALTMASIRYSSQDIENAPQAKVLIIDNIGMLSHLYRYGKIAYIGGGFGVSVHNILEALVYGLPVIFGPKYQHITEARDMTKAGAAFPVNGLKELDLAFSTLNQPAHYLRAQGIIQSYISENQGATKKVIRYLSESMVL